MSKPNNNDVTDWYSKIGCGKKALNKDFNKTYILPESRILLLGPSGSGKTTFLMEFLHRVGPRFYDFYLFTCSTLTEPLYDHLIKNNPEIKAYDDIDKLPSLKDIPDDNYEKLIVIDDFLNLPTKQMIKIKEYVISSRKKHFTTIFMAQNLSEINTTIRRNVNYFVVFKMNDDYLIKHLIKTYGFAVKKDTVIKMYEYATKKPKDFLLIDTTTSDINKIFRHNFLEFLQVKDFEK